MHVSYSVRVDQSRVPSIVMQRDKDMRGRASPKIKYHGTTDDASGLVYYDCFVCSSSSLWPQLGDNENEQIKRNIEFALFCLRLYHY